MLDESGGVGDAAGGGCEGGGVKGCGDRVRGVKGGGRGDGSTGGDGTAFEELCEVELDVDEAPEAPVVVVDAEVELDCDEELVAPAAPVVLVVDDKSLPLVPAVVVDDEPGALEAPVVVDDESLPLCGVSPSLSCRPVGARPPTVGGISASPWRALRPCSTTFWYPPGRSIRRSAASASVAHRRRCMMRAI